MSRIKIIGIIILTLAVITPEAARADWKVYYTGQAAGMFGSGGRGSFATRSQCEAVRTAQPVFEQNNSYCSGYDTPSYTPSAPSSPSGDNGAAARDQEEQRQLQLQNEQAKRYGRAETRRFPSTLCREHRHEHNGNAPQLAMSTENKHVAIENSRGAVSLKERRPDRRARRRRRNRSARANRHAAITIPPTRL